MVFGQSHQWTRARIWQLACPWPVWMLIVGHAAAAIYHHRVLKDRALLKMTFGR